MKKYLFIRIKAAMLSMIFGLNIIVGFACAIGMDMGFNTTHHNEEKATEIHVHADGKKHHHKKEKSRHTDNNKKDDCCTDKVLKISQADKAVPQGAKLLSPVFFSAFVATCYNINISYPSQIITSIKYFVRGHHPPIHDIRIAIQSFQI